MGNCFSVSSFQKNKIVPEPDDSVNASEQQRRGAHQSKLQLDAADASAFPAIASLLALCNGIINSCEPLQDHADALTQQGQIAWNEAQQHTKRTPSHNFLAAIRQTCCACLDKAIHPIITDTEAWIASGNTSSIGLKAASWDTITAQQLHSLLSAAAHHIFNETSEANTQDATLSWVASFTKPLANIVLWAYQHSINFKDEKVAKGKQAKMQRKTSMQQDLSYGVPSMDAIVSMFGLIFFRQVTLESQDTLLSKAKIVDLLVTSFGFDLKTFACCCSALQRVMLLTIHLPATVRKPDQCIRVSVRRRCAFWDALRTLQQHVQQQDVTICQPCKIFPTFLSDWSPGEADAKDTKKQMLQQVAEAGEGHGPRKEFFLLASKNVADFQPAASSSNDHTKSAGDPLEPKLLVYKRSAGVFWYNVQLEKSDELVHAYEVLGWLIGQSLLNRCQLGVPLSSVMVSHLLLGMSHYQPCLTDLQHLDPETAAAIQRTASCSPAQLAALLELESLPSTLTAADYAHQAVKRVLVDDVEWQAQAMSQGFQRVIQHQHCSAVCVSPIDLAVAISGKQTDTSGSRLGSKEDRIDFQKVFKVVMDQELSQGGDGQIVGTLLWQVVNTWPRHDQLKFMEFVTGSDRLPLPGTELLKVECPFVALGGVDKQQLLLNTLPQAHTCANLLELPNYWQALLKVKGLSKAQAESQEMMTQLQDQCKQILETRLRTALDGYMGYGLDELDHD